MEGDIIRNADFWRWLSEHPIDAIREIQAVK